jgi:hypothetical protein
MNKKLNTATKMEVENLHLHTQKLNTATKMKWRNFIEGNETSCSQ